MKLELKKNSLALRLCLCMFFGILFILICASFTVYGLLQESFNKNTTHFLKKELIILRNILVRPNNEEALDQEVVWEPLSINHSFLIKILKPSGQVIKSTPSSTKIPQTFWPTNSPEEDLQFRKIRINKRTFALSSNRINIPYANPSHYQVYIAYDITHNQNLLDSFIRLLIFITMIGMILSIVISFILIKIGLRPLSSFVNHIEKLDLNSRTQVPITKVMHEFNPLIEALNQLFSRIKTSYDRMANFSSNLAHEIRNPINNLMLQTEMSLTKPLPLHKIREMLESNLVEYNRLSSLVDKLLFLARSESENLLSKNHLNFYKEAQAVVEFHQALCEEKNISVEIEGDGEILADKTLFRNALSNLLSNAINYSGHHKKVLISMENGINFKKISVIDNGIGIQAQDLPFLTDRFYRSDRQSNTPEEGLGLGLAIVQSIMKIHKGFLKIESKTGKGTIVSLEFPSLDTPNEIPSGL